MRSNGKRIVKSINSNGNVVVDEYMGKKRNGRCLVFGSNENIIAESTFKKGKKNGVCKVFDNDGLLREYATFKMDKQHGISITYSKESNEVLAVNYINGREDKNSDRSFSLKNTMDSVENKNKILIFIYNQILDGTISLYKYDRLIIKGESNESTVIINFI